MPIGRSSLESHLGDPGRIALRIALSFFALSTLYVALSSWAVIQMENEPERIAVWETLKDSGYILLATIFLYRLISRGIVAALQARADIYGVIDGLTDGFYTLDNAYCFRFVNQTAAKILGRPHDSLIGQSLWSCVSDEARRDLRKLYDLAMITQQVQRTQFFAPRVAAWFELSIYPHADGLSVYFPDITQRRAADERLARKIREQEALARFSAAAFAAGSADAILHEAVNLARDVLNVEFGHVVEIDTVSDTMRDVTTSDPGTLTVNFSKFSAFSPSSLLRFATHAAEPVRFADITQEVRFTIHQRLLDRGVKSGLVTRVPAIAGTHCLVSLFSRQVRTFTDDDVAFMRAMAGILAALNDREKALASLQLRNNALKNIAQGVTIADQSRADRPIIYANAAFLAMTGYSQQEVLGRNIETFLGCDPDIHILESLAAARAAKRRQRFEIPFSRKDGSTFLNAFAAAPMLDADGRLAYYVSVHDDVTETRQRDQKLRDMQKMETVGQLTGGIAHEFNNLLTVIKANAEDMRDELDRATLLHRQADMILQAADRGAGLVKQLMVFARKQAMAPEAVDLNQRLESFVTLLARTLDDGIIVTTALSENLPKVLVDPLQLETALFNIALNARDAMPRGGMLTVATAAMDIAPGEADAAGRELLPGRYVTVGITDNGTGMDQDVAARAFVPFFTTKEVGEGTGLGLAMVYGFAKESGGHAELESQPGKGTTVRLLLPLAPPPAPEAVVDPLARGTDSVLLVEDDELVRESVVGKLERLGYAVTGVSSATQAIAALEEAPGFDLVFSDVVMPGPLNGGDLAHEVQRRWPGTRILMTSGYSEATVRGKVDLPPGVKLLAKPYSNTALAEALTGVLGGLPSRETD